MNSVLLFRESGPPSKRAVVRVRSILSGLSSKRVAAITDISLKACSVKMINRSSCFYTIDQNTQ